MAIICRVLAGQGWRSYLRSRATPRSYEGMVKDTVIIQVLRQLVNDAYRMPFQFSGYLPDSTGIMNHIVKNIVFDLAPGFSEVFRKLKFTSQVSVIEV
ncbi:MULTISPECIES: hypothetical protein [Aeromonas]|uniref:hypothetical protein n=1 Tax=Aeromonas TaxID=642 RepID=UPI0030071AAC